VYFPKFLVNSVLNIKGPLDTGKWTTSRNQEKLYKFMRNSQVLSEDVVDKKLESCFSS